MLKAAVRGQLTTRFRQIEMEESGSKFLRKISDQRQHKHDAIGTRPKVVQRTLFENTSNLGASAASILNGEDKDFQLPSDWTWTTFGDICDIQLGQARNPSNRPGRFATPYLRAANITVEGLDLSDVLEMEFPPRERDFYRLLCDDLVISEASGSPHQVGKPAIWNDELPLCCFQNTVIRLRPILVPSGFVYVLLLHCYVNGIFASTSLGVGINHLGAQRLSRIEVIFPPKTEQNAIVEEVSRQLDSIRQSRTTIDNNLLHARELRESILDRAFQGKLVVPVISAEPASSLLERIKNIRHMVQEEVRPSRVPVRKTSQMTFKPKHRSLLSILREHPGGITPEELFAEANYNVESIDDFYAELAEISEALIQDKPAGADALRWPRDSRVLLRVKED
jgi:type I restriction enzyme S subunit